MPIYVIDKNIKIKDVKSEFKFQKDDYIISYKIYDRMGNIRTENLTDSQKDKIISNIVHNLKYCDNLVSVIEVDKKYLIDINISYRVEKVIIF